VPPPRASVFERHPVLTLAALILFSSVGTDIAFTRFYRWAFPEPASGGAQAYRRQHPVYDHDLRPMASVDGERWGPLVCSYRVDSLGFRDRVVRQVPLADARRRVVFIGDSFTEGMGLDYDKTFVGLVDQALSRRGIEVLNAGVASYCPIIYDRKLRFLLEEVGLRFDELVVYVDIGDIQDEVSYMFDDRGNVVPRYSRRNREGRLNRLYEDPVLGRLHRLEDVLDDNTLATARLYGWLHGLARSSGFRAARWTFDDRAFEEYGREGLEAARQHMDALAAALQHHGVGLTVAVYPWRDQIRAGDRDSRQVRFWREWTSAHGAGLIDYFPRFVGTAPEAEVERRYFIPGDIHWNEEGHRVIAQGFLEHWDEGGSRRD